MFNFGMSRQFSKRNDNLSIREVREEMIGNCFFTGKANLKGNTWQQILPRHNLPDSFQVTLLRQTLRIFLNPHQPVLIDAVHSSSDEINPPNPYRTANTTEELRFAPIPKLDNLPKMKLLEKQAIHPR